MDDWPDGHNKTHTKTGERDGLTWGSDAYCDKQSYIDAQKQKMPSKNGKLLLKFRTIKNSANGYQKFVIHENGVEFFQVHGARPQPSPPLFHQEKF